MRYPRGPLGCSGCGEHEGTCSHAGGGVMQGNVMRQGPGAAGWQGAAAGVVLQDELGDVAGGWGGHWREE